MATSFLLSILSVVLAAFIARGFNPISNQHRELSKGDKQLISFALNMEGLLPEQQAYIAYMGRQLCSYNLGFTNNILVYQLLAFLVLAANYVSVGITGTGYLPCDQAKSLSFAVNLAAALIAGVSQLFLFDKTAQLNQIAGSRLRWEFWQFIGSSQEYNGLSVQDRYNVFTERTDTLIGDDLKAQQQLSTQKKAAEQAAKKDSRDNR